MYKLLNKHGLVIASAIGVAILGIALASSSVDVALRGSYFLIEIAIVTSVGLPIYFAIKDPKSIIKIGASVGVVLALFGVVYSSSTNEVLPQYIAQGVTEGQVQFSGAVITMMIIMVILAVAAVVITEVYNLIKK